MYPKFSGASRPHLLTVLPFKTLKNPIFFGRFAPGEGPNFWALRAQGFIFLKILRILWVRGFNDGGVLILTGW